MAAITATHLATSNTEATQSSYETASVTPSANKLVLAAIVSNVGAGVPNSPTLSGNGLTWVQIGSIVTFDSNTAGLTLFRALGASPSTGAITIDFAGQNQSRCSWSVNEFGNVDTSGANGAVAVVQSASNTSEAAATGITVTLAAFNDTNNATFGAVGKRPSENIVQGTGFTELGENAAVWRIESEFVSSNDTSVDWSWATESFVGAIAVEIKNATQATTTSTSTSTTSTTTSTSTTSTVTTTSTSTSTSSSTSTTSTSTSSSTSTTSTSTSSSTSTTSTSTSSSTSTTSTSTSSSTSTTSTSTSSSTSTTSTSTSSSTSTSTTTTTSTSTSTTSTSSSTSTSTTTSTSTSTTTTTSTSTTSTSSSTSTSTTTSTSTSTTTTTSTSTSTTTTTSTSSSTSTTTTWIYPFIVDTGEASQQAEMNFRVDSGV